MLLASNQHSAIRASHHCGGAIGDRVRNLGYRPSTREKDFLRQHVDTEVRDYTSILNQDLGNIPSQLSTSERNVTDLLAVKSAPSDIHLDIRRTYVDAGIGRGDDRAGRRSIQDSSARGKIARSIS